MLTMEYSNLPCCLNVSHKRKTYDTQNGLNIQLLKVRCWSLVLSFACNLRNTKFVWFAFFFGRKNDLFSQKKTYVIMKIKWWHMCIFKKTAKKTIPYSTLCVVFRIEFCLNISIDYRRRDKFYNHSTMQQKEISVSNRFMSSNIYIFSAFNIILWLCQGCIHNILLTFADNNSLSSRSLWSLGLQKGTNFQEENMTETKKVFVSIKYLTIFYSFIRGWIMWCYFSTAFTAHCVDCAYIYSPKCLVLVRSTFLPSWFQMVSIMAQTYVTIQCNENYQMR